MAGARPVAMIPAMPAVSAVPPFITVRRVSLVMVIPSLANVSLRGSLSPGKSFGAAVQAGESDDAVAVATSVAGVAGDAIDLLPSTGPLPRMRVDPACAPRKAGTGAIMLRPARRNQAKLAGRSQPAAIDLPGIISKL